ncbi:fimbrillin family protein [Mesorhizobium sp. ORM6]
MMADERTARPVSGEIMTDPRAIAAAVRIVRGPAADIVDADYEVMPRLVPAVESVSPPPRLIVAPPIEGMDMLRKPEAPAERPPAARGGPIFWIAGIGAALAAFWVSGGHALVRQVPLFTGVQASALTISGVTSRVDVSGANPVLFVDGEAANDGAGPAILPPLEILVTGNDGRTTRYTLGTSGHALASGERFGFASRLDVPKNGIRTVLVSFAE